MLKKQAANKITNLVNSYRIEAIAIGNGTAGRETERFIQSLRYDRDIQVFVVSESGASIYSASKIALFILRFPKLYFVIFFYLSYILKNK